ncbi:hypothetical protein DERF_014933 [Dermatophagoides farinae]|uniref:Uncharacterized protein n=1 Tax=Dermatophagoides farinae TaxID=6954 RepID=A0A922KVC8_DERFA|nr:hypothetical protein DERF_014933 [Dermatophagoides farinae]
MDDLNLTMKRMCCIIMTGGASSREGKKKPSEYIVKFVNYIIIIIIIIITIEGKQTNIDFECIVDVIHDINKYIIIVVFLSLW